ncbi:25951_t:CDS:1, partial [Racocetra persica]
LGRFVKENIVVNGITSKMMESCGKVYQCTYRNAVKKAQELLYQQVGSVYEVFHSNGLNYEIFMTNNPVEPLWEAFIECAKKLTKNKKFSVSGKMKEKICSNFAKYPSKLAKCIEEYNIFFHKLVYHMCYNEHVSIPEEISPVSSIRKKEIIANLPSLPHISKIIELNNFRYL